MALTADQESLEHELKVSQMQADIELKQAQMAESKQDWRLAPQRVITQGMIAAAATFGALGTVIGYFLGRGH